GQYDASLGEACGDDTHSSVPLDFERAVARIMFPEPFGISNPDTVAGSLVPRMRLMKYYLMSIAIQEILSHGWQRK
ncbi:hypothetical protein, partial [Brucella endophytica]|uniref:hypothetical protein n=1 Tax=Brucella endophytica TaxID=1963359 RepID=UPI0035BC5B91